MLYSIAATLTLRIIKLQWSLVQFLSIKTLILNLRKNL